MQRKADKYRMSTTIFTILLDNNKRFTTFRNVTHNVLFTHKLHKRYCIYQPVLDKFNRYSISLSVSFSNPCQHVQMRWEWFSSCPVSVLVTLYNLQKSITWRHTLLLHLNMTPYYCRLHGGNKISTECCPCP